MRFLLLLAILSGVWEEVGFVMEHFTGWIGEKKFRWTVPPGHTKDMSKRFFFWSKLSANLTLDAKWSKYKNQNSKMGKTRYKYVCKSWIFLCAKVGFIFLYKRLIFFCFLC